MLQRAIAVLRDAGRDFSKGDPFTRAAALSFYAATALVPVLIVAIAIAGVVFGQDAARGAVVRELSAILGRDTAEFIQSAVLSASQLESSVIASILSVAALLIASSGVFVQLRSGLYEIWHIEPAPEVLSRFIRARLTSLALVVALGILLLFSLVLDALVTAFGHLINLYLPYGTAILRAANVLISFALTAVLFGSMYMVLTVNRVSLRNAVSAGVITALLFQLGRVAIGTYLGSSGLGSSFGVAGAMIVLLSWIYYSAVITFFGGALAHALTRNRTSQRAQTVDDVALG